MMRDKVLNRASRCGANESTQRKQVHYLKSGGHAFLISYNYCVQGPGGGYGINFNDVEMWRLICDEKLKLVFSLIKT